MPDKMWRWWMAEQFGWTLEQVDALSIGDRNDYQNYLSGKKRYQSLDK